MHYIQLLIIYLVTCMQLLIIPALSNALRAGCYAVGSLSGN